MRILIADDTSDMRLLLARLLGKWGYQVIIANDGSEAWEILNREPIRLVISDWMMPKLNGIQLCRRIREQEFFPYVYVILLTACDEEADVIAGMKAGADDILAKPVNRTKLQKRLLAAQAVLDSADIAPIPVTAGWSTEAWRARR